MALLTLMFGCSAGGGGAGSADPVIAVRIEPADLALDTRLGAPATAAFTAYATFDDGGEEAFDLVSWTSSSASAGVIDEDGTFTASDENGGETVITATHAGLAGSATVTVRYIEDVVVDADPAVAAAFVAASPTDDSSVTIAYPADGVTVPRNLDGLAFVWSAPEGVVSRLHFTTPITDISVYTTEDVWTADAGLWSIVTAANRRGEVTAQVETGTWSGSALSDVRRGPAIALTVNRFDATGSVLYWSTSDQGILRVPFGSTTPEPFWTSADSDGRCTGCHVLVEDRDRMVVTHDGVNGTFSVLDVAQVDAPRIVVQPVDQNRLTFKTISPDGSLMIGVSDGGLSLYDVDSGQKLRDLPLDGRFTHPDWSPDGTNVVFVRVSETFQSDMSFYGGEIVKVPWDGTSLGALEVLVPAVFGVNCYYPAWSPDGEWIAYNRSTGDAYSDPDSEIWLVSPDGAYDVPLVEANAAGPSLNSYVRWAPLPDDDVLWLAFSSDRGYPLSEREEVPQIWVAAVYPEEVAADGDPSRPAFWLPGQSSASNNHLPVWWSK